MKEKNKRLLNAVGGTLILIVIYCVIAKALKMEPAILIAGGALYFALQALVDNQDKDN